MAIAKDLGWKAMRYTSDKEESGYGDDRFPLNEGGENWDESSYHNSGEHSSGVNGWGGGSTSAARSHIPQGGRLGYGYEGMKWHNANHPQGLYTQLHGPAETHLNEQQFALTRGGVRNTDYRGAKAQMNKQANRQPTLPGMPPKTGDWAPDSNAVPSSVNRIMGHLRGAGIQTGDGMETMRGKIMKQGNPVGGTSAALGTGQSDTHWPGGGRILTGDR